MMEMRVLFHLVIIVLVVGVAIGLNRIFSNVAIVFCLLISIRNINSEENIFDYNQHYVKYF